jgi:hypothetical protein
VPVVSQVVVLQTVLRAVIALLVVLLVLLLSVEASVQVPQVMVTVAQAAVVVALGGNQREHELAE